MSPKPAQVFKATLGVLFPLGLSVFLAYQQSLHDQTVRATTIANEALNRSGKTSEQLLSGFNALVGVDPEYACSPFNILRMRRIALAAAFLGGIGYVSNNKLQCSSFGEHEEPADVGSPDFITSRGYAIRSGRELPLLPGIPLVLLSGSSGFTGFFHPSLVLSMPDTTEGTSLGMVTYSTGKLLMSVGPAKFDGSDFSLAPDTFSGVIHREGQLVAAVRSRRWDSMAYAAIPAIGVSQQFWHVLPFFLLFGLFGATTVILVWRQISAARASLPTLLKTALRRGEISVEFQPIVDMPSGRWVGAEVLARWRRNNGEQVPPDVFIPLAEKEGLITEVTRTVLRLGISQMAPLMRARDCLFLTINLSAADLQEVAILKELEGLVSRYGLKPKNIHLEITERQVMDSNAQVDAVVQLRSRGFEVGTDDFGVGCSNLGYLHSIPLDYIKIDRSFMTNSLRGEAPYDIVDTIIRLAKTRSIEIIAEGIETEAQRSRLTEQGVRYGQGWLFAKAMPSLEFVARFGAASQHASARKTSSGDVPTLTSAA